MMSCLIFSLKKKHVWRVYYALSQFASQSLLKKWNAWLFLWNQIKRLIISSEKMKCLIISSEKNEAPHYFFRKKLIFIWRNNDAFHFFLKRWWGPLAQHLNKHLNVFSSVKKSSAPLILKKKWVASWFIQKKKSTSLFLQKGHSTFFLKIYIIRLTGSPTYRHANAFFFNEQMKHHIISS